LGWVQNQEMVQLLSQLQLQRPGPAQLAEVTDQVGTPTTNHAPWHGLHMLVWILLVKTTKTLGVYYPGGVARAHLTRGCQQSHQGKQCLFPKGLLLVNATPKHAVLNGIHQPSKPPASKHAGSLPVTNEQEKHDMQQLGRQVWVSSVLPCICCRPNNSCCSSCILMTVSLDCIKLISMLHSTALRPLS